MNLVSAILALIPAIAKILDNPAITKALSSFVGLFTKTEGEAAVDKFKGEIKGRKEASLKRNEAIKNCLWQSFKITFRSPFEKYLIHQECTPSGTLQDS